MAVYQPGLISAGVGSYQSVITSLALALSHGAAGIWTAINSYVGQSPLPFVILVFKLRPKIILAPPSPLPPLCVCVCVCVALFLKVYQRKVILRVREQILKLVCMCGAVAPLYIDLYIGIHVVPGNATR